MTSISRIDKLNLFKRLLRYSEQLKYTDREFYVNRVKEEFHRNRQLTDQKDVTFFYEIDKSKVPKLNEKELKEGFIHGSGPGGQNVNKLSNCVQLTHLPTGIVVKCHQDRLQQRNRKIARQLLQTKLDNLINGDQSVSAQRHRMIVNRFSKREKRREKNRDLKKQFKEEELKRRTVDNNTNQNDSDFSRNN